jgi:hypothetical protein
MAAKMPSSVEPMVKELEMAARGGGVAVGSVGLPPSSPSSSILPPRPPLHGETRGFSPEFEQFNMVAVGQESSADQVLVTSY